MAQLGKQILKQNLLVKGPFFLPLWELGYLLSRLYQNLFTVSFCFTFSKKYWMTLPQRSWKEVLLVTIWHSGEEIWENPQSRHPSCVPVDIQNYLYPAQGFRKNQHCLTMPQKMWQATEEWRGRLPGPRDSCIIGVRTSRPCRMGGCSSANTATNPLSIEYELPQIVPWVWCLSLDEIVTSTNPN